MTGAPLAGWYPAAHANDELRYWDGQRWYDEAAPAPEPAAGWYEAPHAAGELRYWDGREWLEAAQEHATQEHAAQEYAAQEHAAQEHATQEYATQEYAAQEYAVQEYAAEPAETYSAGWYGAPHANGEPRYWDGGRWVEEASYGHAPAVPAPQMPPAPQASLFAATELALPALFVGMAALLASAVPWLGLLLAIAAVGLGITACLRRESTGRAITGLSLGAIALLVGLVTTAASMG